MATHSSIPAWEIPWTEEPDGLQSRGRKESDTTEQGPSKQCELWQKEGTPVTAESRALETGRPGSESHLHPQV